MENVLGIITISQPAAELARMTGKGHTAVLPFGGEYLVIDFVLSSMVNSGMENVGILLQGQYRPVMNHLRSGRDWHLVRKRDGLFFLPPQCDGESDLANLYHNLDYVEASRQEYVLAVGSHLVCSMDYHKVMHFHQAHKADITIVTGGGEPAEEAAAHTAILVDQAGRIQGIADTGHDLVSLDMYLMSKPLFLELVRTGYEKGFSGSVQELFLRQSGRLRIYGYRHKGYIARISSAQSYYRHHMELLQMGKWQQFFAEAGMTYTCDQDDPPAVYLSDAKVHNAIVANGCLIGGFIENSVIFHGVTVESGATIKNSIIMPGCHVAGSARLENVICDKGVRISGGKCLKGEPAQTMVVHKAQ